MVHKILINFNRQLMLACSYWAAMDREFNIARGAWAIIISRVSMLWSFVIIITGIAKYSKHRHQILLTDRLSETYMTSHVSQQLFISFQGQNITSAAEKADSWNWKDPLLLDYLPFISTYSSLYHLLIVLYAALSLAWRIYLAYFHEYNIIPRDSVRTAPMFDVRQEMFNFFISGPTQSRRASALSRKRIEDKAIAHMMPESGDGNGIEIRSGSYLSLMHEQEWPASEQMSRQPRRRFNSEGNIAMLDSDQGLLIWRYCNQSTYYIPIGGGDYLHDKSEARWWYLARRVYNFISLVLIGWLIFMYLGLMDLEQPVDLFGYPPRDGNGAAIITFLTLYGMVEQIYFSLQILTFFCLTNLVVTLYHADLTYKVKSIQSELKELAEMFRIRAIDTLPLDQVLRHKLRICTYFDSIKTYDKIISRYSVASHVALIGAFLSGKGYLLVDNRLFRLGALATIASSALSFTYLHLISEHVERQSYPIKKYICIILAMEQNPVLKRGMAAHFARLLLVRRRENVHFRWFVSINHAHVSQVALAPFGLAVYNYVKCQLVYSSFRKKSNGLPMHDQRGLLGNHVLSMTFRNNFCNQMLQAHAEKGKTIGWLMNDKFAATSVDLDLIKLFIYDEPNEHINRSRPDYPMREIEHSLMLAQDGEWRKLRRHFAPAFRSTKFKTPTVIGEIESSIEKLIDHIESKLEGTSRAEGCQSKLFQIDDLAHKYSLNLVFSSLYKQDNLIDFNEENSYWTRMVDEGLLAGQTSVFMKASVLFPALKSAIDSLIWHFTSQGKWRRNIMHFVKMQAKLRLEARGEAQELQANKNRVNKLDLDNFVMKDGTKFKRNMIDDVIDHFLDGKLTKNEFFDTSCHLLGAADKTSSDAIVHTLYLLGRHHDIQDKLRNEILADGMDAEYLTWVLNESLRLRPPSPIGCSRTVTRDIKLDGGKVLPANTFVLTPNYVIHRLREYWGEDADEFKPERWRDTSHFHPMQYIPFGAGSRVCPGKDFALFEMKMLLSALLMRYNFACQHKDDIYTFDSPGMVYILPNSPTYITITKIK